MMFQALVDRRWHGGMRGRLGLAFALIAAFLSVNVQASEPTALHTNQNYIEEAAQSRPIDTNDLISVFRFVFGSLPDSVTVYPTENYYYYSFFHDGVEFAGNMRLDASDRDKGILHFAYFSAYAIWNRELVSQYKPLSEEDGVSVKRLGPLRYQIAFEGKTVIFNLNDLTNVRPPPGTLSAEEEYLGPVFDESGVEFYLVFNKSLSIFHFILNESGMVPEVLDPSYVSDRIWIGHRTGFAYFSDRFRNRKILVGVYNANSLVNNYFDGPFDQLPDNFLKGDALKDALEAAFPTVKGKIDRFGNAEGGQTRILVTPYLYYDSQAELQYFADCVKTAGDDPDAYYQCFSVAQDEDEDTGSPDTPDTETQDPALPKPDKSD